MSMFEHGTVAQHAKIGKMLSEVEAVLKWNSLEKLLHGGKRCKYSDCGHPSIYLLRGRPRPR